MAAEGASVAMAEKDSSPDVSISVCNPLGVTRSDTHHRSFVDAAWDKFNGEMAVDDCIGIYMPKKGPAKITDSGHMILPWRVHMTDCGITEAGQHSDMAAMCRNVTELDLAQNSITSLEEVIQVIRCMPSLIFLNLTNNPLHSSSISLAARIACSAPSPSPSPSPSTASGPLVPDPGDLSGRGSWEAGSPTSDAASTSDTSSSGEGTREEDLSPGFQPPHPCQGGEGGMKKEDTTTSNVPPQSPRTATEDLGSDETNANVETTTTSSTPPPDPTSSSPGNNNSGSVTGETTATAAETSMRAGTDSASPTKTEHSRGVRSESGPAPVSLGVSPPVAAFSTLRQLVLNDTGVEWRGIVGLLRLFPSLEELHLSLNLFHRVDIPAGFAYPSLKRLFFNNNQVGAWSQICRLGRTFPGLQHLFLVENCLTSLEGEEGEEGDVGGQVFPALTVLSLNKTQLRGWKEVDRLRDFPSLCDVRLQGIPFLEAQDEGCRRQQLVARLPNIERLNGSSVTHEERLDAERAFIRLFMDQDHKPDRYQELVAVYGELDPLVKVSLRPRTLFSVFLVVGERREPFEVNTNQTVRELKKSLQNVAGLPCSKFNVFYLDKQCAFGADKLRYPDKKLYTYNVADGDEFIIQPKD